jgi:hypothetical protein
VTNLFRVPLEVLTAVVYLSYDRIGIAGCVETLGVTSLA